MIEGAIERSVGCGIRAVGRIFEEEDDAVEGLKGEEVGGVEGDELFELNVLDAKVFYKRREDALGSMSECLMDWTSVAILTASDSTAKQKQKARLISRPSSIVGCIRQPRQTHWYSSPRS